MPNSIPHHASKSVIYTLVSEVQPLNAELPILVTLLGMVMLVSEVQPLNAFSSIFVPPVISTVLRDDGTRSLLEE